MAVQKQFEIVFQIERVSMPKDHLGARRAGLLLLTRIFMADLPDERQAQYHWLR